MSGSGGGVDEEKYLKRRDFSIISYKENISLLYLVCIAVTAVVMAKVTMLVMNC